MRKMYSKEQVANIAGNVARDIKDIYPGGGVGGGTLKIHGTTEFLDELWIKTNIINMNEDTTVIGYQGNGSLKIEVPFEVDAEGSDMSLSADGIYLNAQTVVNSDYDFQADRGTVGGMTFESADDSHGIYFQTELIYMGDLPTTDPEQEGYLWNDNGVLKISQG